MKVESKFLNAADLTLAVDQCEILPLAIKGAVRLGLNRNQRNRTLAVEKESVLLVIRMMQRKGGKR